LRQIADEAGVSVNTLIGEFMRAGLPRKRQRTYPPQPPQPPSPGRRHPSHRDARRLTHQGETRTIADWAARLGIPVPTIYSRLARGLPVAEVLKRPVEAAGGEGGARRPRKPPDGPRLTTPPIGVPYGASDHASEAGGRRCPSCPAGR
jgi:hypothetical protein